MKGPGYTTRDLAYYAGLFGGIMLVYLICQPYGVHPVVRLIVGLIVGVALGWMTERAFFPPRGPSGGGPQGVA